MIKKRTFTFMVTEKCNLNCKYCYEHSKTAACMDIEIAKKAVECANTYIKFDNEVIWEFIGGEPFLVPKLLDELTDFIRKTTKSYKNIFNITTNGTQFENPAVKNYIEKNHKWLSIGISLDGTREIHNINRNDSYDQIVQHIPWLLKLMPWTSIKATINRDSLVCLNESIKSLYETKVKYIAANAIYEENWNNDDAKLFEEQLIKIADWFSKDEKGTVLTLFSPAFTMNTKRKGNWCGSGKYMKAFGIDGTIYPCHRFCTDKTWACGDIFNGFNEDKLIPFTFCSQHIGNCQGCEFEGICPECIAYNYQVSGDVFCRDNKICVMYKAQRKANEYFKKIMDDKGKNIATI